MRFSIHYTRPKNKKPVKTVVEADNPVNAREMCRTEVRRQHGPGAVFVVDCRPESADPWDSGARVKGCY